MLAEADPRYVAAILVQITAFVFPGTPALIALIWGQRPRVLRAILWFGFSACALGAAGGLSNPPSQIWLGMLISACAYALALVRTWPKATPSPPKP